MENENKQIYKALANINKGVNAIAKNRKNEQQGFKFRGIDDVMNELHSLFADNEVLILQDIVDITTTERVNKNGTTLFQVRVTSDYHLIHSSGDRHTCRITGEAMDSGDKAVTKAMSIALKYLLLQLFLIPTEEDKDPDAVVHEVKPENPFDNTEYLQAFMMIKEAETEAALGEIYKTFATFQKDKEFIKALTSKKVEIKRKKGEVL